MEKIVKHTLFLEYGQGLFATAISEVLSFDEKEVKLSLSSGGKLLVQGAKMKINCFETGSGEFKLVGEVSAVKYLSHTSSKFKKLFG